MSRPEEGGWYSPVPDLCDFNMMKSVNQKAEKHKRSKGSTCPGPWLGTGVPRGAAEGSQGILCPQLQRKPWMHPTAWCIPTSLPASQKMSGEYAGVVGACSGTARGGWVTKGDGGSRLAGVGTHSHTHHTWHRCSSCLQGHSTCTCT